jgi:hypothetical protein
MMRSCEYVRRLLFLTRVGVLSLASVLAHAGSQPNSIAQAKKIFADARAVSAKEGGRLWGRKLYGRLLLVDPKTRAVVANEPDPQGVLHATEGVYVGTLPALPRPNGLPRLMPLKPAIVRF